MYIRRSRMKNTLQLRACLFPEETIVLTPNTSFVHHKIPRAELVVVQMMDWNQLIGANVCLHSAILPHHISWSHGGHHFYSNPGNTERQNELPEGTCMSTTRTWCCKHQESRWISATQRYTYQQAGKQVRKPHLVPVEAATQQALLWRVLNHCRCYIATSLYCRRTYFPGSWCWAHFYSYWSKLTSTSTHFLPLAEARQELQILWNLRSSPLKHLLAWQLWGVFEARSMGLERKDKAASISALPERRRKKKKRGNTLNVGKAKGFCLKETSLLPSCSNTYMCVSAAQKWNPNMQQWTTCWYSAVELDRVAWRGKLLGGRRNRAAV